MLGGVLFGMELYRTWNVSGKQCHWERNMECNDSGWLGMGWYRGLSMGCYWGRNTIGDRMLLEMEYGMSLGMKCCWDIIGHGMLLEMEYGKFFGMKCCWGCNVSLPSPSNPTCAAWNVFGDEKRNINWDGTLSGMKCLPPPSQHPNLCSVARLRA